MRFVLEILDGPLAGRTVELNPGEVVSVGRTAKSQLMLPHDSFLSGMHFQVECGEEGCVLKDCNSSNGTWVNGNKVLHQAVSEGDQISAGQTRFKVSGENSNTLTMDRSSSTVLFAAPKLSDFDTPPQALRELEPVVLTPAQHVVVKYLQFQTAPLYAILNATLEERVPHYLLGSGEVYQYLADGLTQGEQMPPGVYLAYIPATSPLLPKLVHDGWSRHWTLFFTCSHPFGEVRKHLRQFLLMQTEEGKKFFFRYYDPRLLQSYLPSCTPQEITQFFGPIQSFFMESAYDPTKLVEFSVTPQGLGGKVMPIG